MKTHILGFLAVLALFSGNLYSANSKKLTRENFNTALTLFTGIHPNFAGFVKTLRDRSKSGHIYLLDFENSEEKMAYWILRDIALGIQPGAVIRTFDQRHESFINEIDSSIVDVLGDD